MVGATGIEPVTPNMSTKRPFNDSNGVRWLSCARAGWKRLVFAPVALHLRATRTPVLGPRAAFGYRAERHTQLAGAAQTTGFHGPSFGRRRRRDISARSRYALLRANPASDISLDRDMGQTRRGAARKMIASQGRQLPADPPVASLSPKELDGYAGVYSAGSDRTVTIFRQGDEFAASTSGEPIARLAAEVRDVFHARLAAQEHRLSARRKRSRHGICEPSRRAQFAVLQDLGHRTRQAAWRQPRLRKLGSSGLRMAPTKACPPVQSGIWTK